MEFDIDRALEQIATSYGWEVENSVVGEWMLDFYIVKHGYYNSVHVSIRMEFYDRDYDFAYDDGSWIFDEFDGMFSAEELEQLIDEAWHIYNEFTEQVSAAYPFPNNPTKY